MTTSMHTSPVLIDATGKIRSLNKQAKQKQPRPEASAFGEREIQELVHNLPDVLPMAQIEPAFLPLIPVCMELGTPRGYLDNLWVTPAGGLVLGECKLVKNPQARREVIAQALDYAQALCGWSLDELEKNINLALKTSEVRLWKLVREARGIEGDLDPDSGLDERAFNDSVQRRLRSGHVMVLIIGDGITEGAESLTSFLQLHAGFHAGLALVDLSIWDLPDGQRLVVPRVPMKTVLIERGIVRVDSDQRVTIEPPKSGTGSQETTPSETEFIEQLRDRRPKLVEGLLDVASRAAALGVTPEFGRSMILRLSLTPDLRGSAGYVDSYGTVWLTDSYSIAEKLGVRDAADRYLKAIAAACGGSFKPSDWKTNPTVLGPRGSTVNLAELLPHREAWMTALGNFVAELKAAANASES